MVEQKKCLTCGATESKKWIVRENAIGNKGYFCSPKCYQEYKKKNEALGVCEFC